MKTKTELMFLKTFAWFAAAVLIWLASALFTPAQTLSSTNILPYTYYSGTNNSYTFLVTNISLPKQHWTQFTHGGITNFNALGRTNIIIRYQLQISNDWVTIETHYPSATNATTDSFLSTVSKVSIPGRIQVVTTNSLPMGALRSQVQ